VDPWWPDGVFRAVQNIHRGSRGGGTPVCGGAGGGGCKRMERMALLGQGCVVVTGNRSVGDEVGGYYGVWAVVGVP